MARKKKSSNSSRKKASRSTKKRSTSRSKSESSGNANNGGPGGLADQVDIPDTLPVLPIRGTVMFPGTIMPLGVGRPASRKLLDESLPESKIIALVTQLDEDEDEPMRDGLYEVGTAAMVLKLIRQPDETVSIIAHGIGRIRIDKYTQRKPFFKAKVSKLTDQPGRGKNFNAGVAQLKDQARELIDLTPNAPEQAMTVLMNINEPGNLSDFLAANLDLEVEQKQDLLEEAAVAKRVRSVHQYVSKQLEIVKLQNKIQADVNTSISDSQRKFYLREQIKAIQRELGEDDESTTAIVEELRDRIIQADPPEAVMDEADRDLKRLESVHPASPEYSVIVSYLELIAELPWKESTEDNLDLDRARKILDRDHFNLQKVKRRLIEYLAVRKLNPEGRGPILCLVGPPGVGKTSLGHSVADALGRNFVRMSLGGIRDEAEIRGHRRTYIGAMPGRIIQEIRRAESNNPVMMLDEIDKLGNDYRGDPSSALLEVLDPRQNHAFVDRYLDLPFDLSQVLFVATANYIGNVPRALRDRMEIIEIAGYTDYDKAAIASKYLVPRQLKENGLTKSLCKWRIGAIRKVINDYTREAGVRELERQIGSVCRGIAAEVARKKRKPTRAIMVNEAKVRDVLGPEKYIREEHDRTQTPGVVMGLAYTPVGGEVLYIEATKYHGGGKVQLTGQIGDVMKESAMAAMSLFKSRADEFQFDLKLLKNVDVHIHVPAGAVPKDGPSAGVAMYCAIVSLMLDLPVRKDLAMTGEISLRGNVMPVGGIKEKTLAAARLGVSTILLPLQNEADLEEVDTKVKQKCKFQLIDDTDELLEYAFGKQRIRTAIKALKKRQKEQQESGKIETVTVMP